MGFHGGYATWVSFMNLMGTERSWGLWVLAVLCTVGDVAVRGDEEQPRPRRYDQRIRLHRAPFESEAEIPDYVETAEQPPAADLRAAPPPPRERERPRVQDEDQRNWLLNSILASMALSGEEPEGGQDDREDEPEAPGAALMALRQWGWLSAYVLQVQNWEQEQEARSRDMEQRAEEEEQAAEALAGGEQGQESLILAQPFEWQRVEGQEVWNEERHAAAPADPGSAGSAIEAEYRAALGAGAGTGMQTPVPELEEQRDSILFERTRKLLQSGAPGSSHEVPDRFARSRELEGVGAMDTAPPIPPATDSPGRTFAEDRPRHHRAPAGYTPPSYTPLEVSPIAPADRVTAPYRDRFSETAWDSAPFGER